MRTAAVLMEILHRSGVRRLFGNPGTTELPFLDALPDSGLEYVVGLQEATAVAAADGYAPPAVAVGAKTPRLLTAGKQDTGLLVDDPILAGDLVRMAEQFTKWSYQIRGAA